MLHLNLTNVETSDIKFEVSKFPDGQQTLNLKSSRYEVNNEDIVIKSRLNSFKDLEIIICANQALKNAGADSVSLYVPYFLGSRSDRKFQEGGVNYLKQVICPIINSQNFKRVVTMDPHSDVLEACLNNYDKKNNFELVKFATMLRDSPNIGTGNLTINNDPRVLQFGRFLRKTKLNELPQLFNVLVGNMSIVGPRPLTSDTFSMYVKSTQKAILEVKPGLSGIGSLIFRNEELLVLGNKNPREFYAQKISPYKGELELWYINNQSIRMYFRVIFLTLLVVFGCNQKIIYSMLVGLPKPTLEIKEALRSLR
jgi:lipopolysaccharide/colanic/teichoic acid biosynthesis glycosyltransferase